MKWRAFNMMEKFTAPKGCKIESITNLKNGSFVVVVSEDEKLIPNVTGIVDIKTEDISEIAPNFFEAVGYLLEDLYSANIDTTNKHKIKLDATNQLIILAESRNSYDEFEADFNDKSQRKYYPRFIIDNNKMRFWKTDWTCTEPSCITSSTFFKTPERAEQFAKQFIGLFKVAMGL